MIIEKANSGYFIKCNNCGKETNIYPTIANVIDFIYDEKWLIDTIKNEHICCECYNKLNKKRGKK